MRTLLRTASFSFGLLAWLVWAGCSKPPAPPQPISVEQAPASLEEAFKTASDEARKLVADAVGAFGAKDFTKALFALQALSARSDLTGEQRDLASRAMLAANQALTEQANSGDQNAQKTLQFRRATK